MRIVAAWVGGGGGLVMAGWLAGRDWWLLVLRHDEDGGEGRGEVLLLNPVERRETDAQSRVCTSFYTILVGDICRPVCNISCSKCRKCCRLVLNLQFRRYSKQYK